MIKILIPVVGILMAVSTFVAVMRYSSMLAGWWL
jgi:hypothetical protein